MTPSLDSEMSEVPTERAVNKESSLLHQIVHQPHNTFSTLVYCHCFVILGCTISILGPLLPQLKQFLNVESDSKMGFLFTIRGLGFVVGSIVCGRLIHCLQVKYILCGVLLLASACLLLIPIVDVYEFSCIVHFALGFCGSQIDLACNTVTMRLWGKKGGPVLQLLHGMFGIGALVCPAVIAIILQYVPTVSYSLKYSYFLFSAFCLSAIPGTLLSVDIDLRDPEHKQRDHQAVERRQKRRLTGRHDNALSHAIPHQTDVLKSEFTQEEDMFALGSPISDATFPDDSDFDTELRSTDSVSPSPLPLGKPATSYHNLEDPSKIAVSRSRQAARITTRLQSFITEEVFSPRMVVYTLMSIFLGLYVGAEVGFGSIVPTYVTQLKLGNASQAALSSSLFWIGLTAGRMAAVPLSLFLSPAVILFADIFGCLVSVVLLFIFQKSLPIIWFSSVIFGLFMSSIYPSGMAFPQVTLGYQLTGPMTSLLVVGASTGEMVIPLLIEVFFEVTGPISMLVVCTICIVASLGVLIVLMLVFKPKEWIGKISKRLKGGEDAQET